MNDFTKEELEDLYICCGGSIHDDHPLEDWKEALQIKIQGMLDNYKKPCDHKWMNMHYAYMQCEKCFVRKGIYE